MNEGSACDAASVHFRPSITRTDMLFQNIRLHLRRVVSQRSGGPTDLRPFALQTVQLLWTRYQSLVPTSSNSTIWHRTMGSEGWRTAAGKATVGLASHCPCVTDCSGLPAKDSRSRKERWTPDYATVRIWHHFTLLMSRTTISVCFR